MPKKLRESLTEDQIAQCKSTTIILHLNLSLVFFKRDAAKDCLKNAKDAVTLDDTNSKSHYRLAVAYKLNNDFEPAKEHLALAVKLEPGNKKLRKEYQDLTQAMSKKEKEWYSKMSGFLGSDKLKKLEEKDQEDEKLKFKIHR
jgi:Tfp pilus assembly protein PilF